MDFPTKIKMAEAVSKIKEAELARRMDTTPQAFNQRMKTGKFKYEELEQMAQAMGAFLMEQRYDKSRQCFEALAAFFMPWVRALPEKRQRTMRGRSGRHLCCCG